MFGLWFVNQNLDMYSVTARLAALVVMILIFLPLHEIIHIKIAKSFCGEHLRIRDFSFFDFFDPVGAIFMLIFQYGWAKRFMYSENLNINKHEIVITYLSGPLFNFLSAVLFNSIAIFIPLFGLDAFSGWIFLFLQCIVEINITLTTINLLPVPPFDGFKVVEAFIPVKYLEKYYRNYFLIFIVLSVLLLSGIFEVPLSILEQAVFRAVNLLSKIPLMIFRAFLLFKYSMGQ